MSSPDLPSQVAGEVVGAVARLASGGFRQCLKNPAMLARWFASRRYRHATEIRKHVWKIRCFQRDELTPQALAGIDAGIDAFDRILRSGPSRDRLEAGIHDLDTCAQKWLRPYANASLRENVEVFLVAIGVAMAIRTFFLQPFKIPTGSMQPTLFGVHFEDLRNRPDVAIPGRVGRFFDAVLHGRYYHELVAEADGEVVRIEPTRTTAFVSHQDIVLRYREGGTSREKTHTVWFSPVDGHGGDLRGLRGVVGWERPELFHPLLPGQPFKKGDTLFRLKDSAGDHLFVDRLTYNFRPPKRGEIIVFETRNIPGLPPDQFYIKRLVGLGGERIRVGDDRHLIIDDRRLDAATPHFERVYGSTNPPADSRYSGHVNGAVARALHRFGDLAPYFPDARTEFQIGRQRLMVMGDNTLNSADSRSWGDFAQTNVVGRYCFVWWPFTDRWGTTPR
jgi:signal peptidase I